MMHDRDSEAISKTRASCFIGVFKHSQTIKALGVRPRAFIIFLVFGNPDETLTLVFEILLQQYYKRRFHFGVKQNLFLKKFNRGALLPRKK